MIYRAAIILAMFVFLAGCASNPPLRTFVLSTPFVSVAGTSSVLNEPRVQLQPVSVPDYMDTTDILTRSGQNEVTTSSTGRWGERLSQGLTHALAAALVARLPHDFVTLDPSHGKSNRQIMVSVDAFDVWPDGHSALVATWTVLENDDRIVAVEGRGNFNTPPTETPDLASDAVVVAAMTSAISQLADSIALSAAH
jgi:uncharacterized lipoprotein YmbA